MPTVRGFLVTTVLLVATVAAITSAAAGRQTKDSPVNGTSAMFFRLTDCP